MTAREQDGIPGCFHPLGVETPLRECGFRPGQQALYIIGVLRIIRQAQKFPIQRYGRIDVAVDGLANLLYRHWLRHSRSEQGCGE
jgi:hypothetical protein